MSESKKSLKIVAYSMDGVGHVNACIGLLENLKKRGHQIVLVVSDSWKGKIEQHGFTNVFREGDKPSSTSSSSPANQPKVNPGDKFSEHLKKMGICEPGNSYQKLAKIVEFLFGKVQNKETFTSLEKDLQVVIEEHKPDLFIIDNFHLPAVVCHSGKPWVRIVSPHPLFFEQYDNIPPSCSGYPLNGDRSEWPTFRELNRKFHYSEFWSEILKELGHEPYPDDIKLPPTYALSVYGYPAELDYRDVCKYQDNWINVETFMRDSKFEQFKIPESLDNVRDKYPGKLIYFSLGSMCSGDIDLMKKFVKILSKTKHRYIVSKGPRHSEFELAENMWGDRFVPQAGILPVVDLVITHGGNNTFTEALSLGKPMIVFPIFGDQFDNAQRITEVGLGRRLDPYDFEEQKLTDAIDQLLYDDTINERLRKMTKRILGHDRFKEAVQRIEALCD